MPAFFIVQSNKSFRCLLHSLKSKGDSTTLVIAITLGHLCDHLGGDIVKKGSWFGWGNGLMLVVASLVIFIVASCAAPPDSQTDQPVTWVKVFAETGKNLTGMDVFQDEAYYVLSGVCWSSTDPGTIYILKIDQSGGQVDGWPKIFAENSVTEAPVLSFLSWDQDWKYVFATTTLSNQFYFLRTGPDGIPSQECSHDSPRSSYVESFEPVSNIEFILGFRPAVDTPEGWRSIAAGRIRGTDMQYFTWNEIKEIEGQPINCSSCHVFPDPELEDGYLVLGSLKMGAWEKSRVFAFLLDSGGSIRKDFYKYDGKNAKVYAMTSDGGYIIAGTFVEGLNDYIFAMKIKINSSGDFEEDWYWDTPLISGGYIGGVSGTTDGGCVITGDINTATSRDAYLVKLSSNGVKQWEKTYGDADHDEVPLAVIQTSDEGYLLVGWIKDKDNPSALYKILTVKTDKDGNL